MDTPQTRSQRVWRHVFMHTKVLRTSLPSIHLCLLYIPLSCVYLCLLYYLCLVYALSPGVCTCIPLSYGNYVYSCLAYIFAFHVSMSSALPVSCVCLGLLACVHVHLDRTACLHAHLCLAYTFAGIHLCLLYNLCFVYALSFGVCTCILQSHGVCTCIPVSCVHLCLVCIYVFCITMCTPLSDVYLRLMGCRCLVYTVVLCISRVLWFLCLMCIYVVCVAVVSCIPLSCVYLFSCVTVV